MAPPLDPQLQTEVNQFLNECVAQAAFYQKAVHHVATDLPVATPFRQQRWLSRIISSGLFRRPMSQLVKRHDAGGQVTAPTILDGIIITAFEQAMQPSTNDELPTVIVISVE